MNYPISGNYYEIAKRINSGKKSLSEWYENRCGIAIFVISDKQSVFFTEDICDDKLIHLEMAHIALAMIYGREFESNDFPTENIYGYVFDADNQHVLVLNVNTVSDNQYFYIARLLDEISIHNSKCEDQVEFWLFNGDDSYYSYDALDIKRIIKKNIRHDKTTHDKYIIGKILNDEELVYCFKNKFQVKTVGELVNVIKMLGFEGYFNYRHILESIYPNFGQILELAKEVKIERFAEEVDHSIDLMDELELINYLCTLNNILVKRMVKSDS